MATLAEHQSKPTRSLGRGTTTRNLGAKTIAPSVAPVDRPGVIKQFANKVGDVGTQTAKLAGAAAVATGKFVGNTAIDIGKAAYGAGHTAVDIAVQPLINKQISDASRRLDEVQTNLVAEFGAGRISRENYIKALKDLSLANQQLSKDTQKVTSGPTPQQRAMDVAETAVNVLSLGSFITVKAGVKAGVTEATEGLLGKAATKLDDLVMKVPATRALVERNVAALSKREAQKLAGETIEQYVRREGKNVAVGLLIKRPLFYQQNIGGAEQIYSKVLNGDYPGALKSSAWLATQMIRGGPIGGAFTAVGWAKSKARPLIYGQDSLIDAVSQRIGNKNGAQIARFLQTTKERAPGEFGNMEKDFRVWQEGYLRAADGDVQRAADMVEDYFVQQGVNLDNLTPSDIYKSYRNHRAADELWQALTQGKKEVIKGLTKADASKYTPVRWDASTRDGIIAAIVKAGTSIEDQKAALQALADQPGAGWAHNDLLMTKLNKVIDDAHVQGIAKKHSVEVVEAVAEPTRKEIESYAHTFGISRKQAALDLKAGPSSVKDVAEGKSVTTLIQEGIHAIDAAAVSANMPKKIAAQFAKLGYTIALPKGGRRTPFLKVEETRRLLTGAIKGDPEIFDAATSAHPTLAFLASGLERAGLSPQSATRTATRRLSESVMTSLNSTAAAQEMGISANKDGDLITGGEALLHRLQQYVENMKPSRAGNVLVAGRANASAVIDIRQLSPKEISEALGISKDAARSVSKAIIKGYTDVPLELRGLGDFVTDRLYAINPAHKYYSRIQSALRYTYNPFFRVQERTESALLARVEANSLVFNKTRAELNEGTALLDESGFFSSSLSGEAAQDQVLGRVTANITQAQKRSLAGLAYNLAESRGLTLDEMIAQHRDEVVDALRVVVQYPTHGFTSTPLARTLNMAFFPMRYNIKVTQVAANLIAKQPPNVQLATVNSIFKMRDWLKSDEGIRWQSTHADAIQVLKWITPINSIEYTMNLLSHRPDSAAELGALGGLPLGVITQMLDSQGIISLNRPYVNPKTGDVIPKYIPKSVQARASVAIGDVLGSMFTYPGRILGLPGKEATIRDAVKQFIETNGEDFDKRIETDKLTPLQQNWIRVLKGDMSEEALDSLYNSPAPGQFNYYTLPPLDLPIRPPTSRFSGVQRRTNLPTKKSKSKSSKAKPVALSIPSR